MRVTHMEWLTDTYTHTHNTQSYLPSSDRIDTQDVRATERPSDGQKLLTTQPDEMREPKISFVVCRSVNCLHTTADGDTKTITNQQQQKQKQHNIFQLYRKSGATIFPKSSLNGRIFIHEKRTTADWCLAWYDFRKSLIRYYHVHHRTYTTKNECCCCCFSVWSVIVWLSVPYVRTQKPKAIKILIPKWGWICMTLLSCNVFSTTNNPFAR